MRFLTDHPGASTFLTMSFDLSAFSLMVGDKALVHASTTANADAYFKLAILFMAGKLLKSHFGMAMLTFNRTK